MGLASDRRESLDRQPRRHRRRASEDVSPALCVQTGLISISRGRETPLGNQTMKTAPPSIYAAIIAIVGATLTVGGVRLVSLGGSYYYVIAGIVLLASAFLLWRGDKRGATLYGFLLIGTLAWSLVEVGFDAWA